MDEKDKQNLGVLLLLGGFVWLLLSMPTGAGVLVTLVTHPSPSQVIAVALIVVLLPAALCWVGSWRLLHIRLN